MNLKKFIKILNNSKLSCWAPKEILLTTHRDKKIIESRFEFVFLYHPKIYCISEEYYTVRGECSEAYSVFAHDYIYRDVSKDTFIFSKGLHGHEEGLYINVPEVFLIDATEEELKKRMKPDFILSETIKFFLANSLENLETEKIIYTRKP